MAEKSTIAHFQEISKLLDAKNDKYERIYKTNRDITQKCKRIIFSLHRIPGQCDKEGKIILNNSSDEFRDIEQTLLKYIAMELKGEDPYQFLHAYTGGVQEYIEAISFHHYLLKEQIISYPEVQSRVTFRANFSSESSELSLSVLIPQKEYMLGLGDLTGELMRFCIKCISTGDFNRCHKICSSLKSINEGFLSLGYIRSKELLHKISVFKTSLCKVEDACYFLKLRESELPSDLLATLLAVENEEREQFIQ